MEVTRRNLIQILSAAPAIAEAQTHEHTVPPASKPAPYRRKVIDDKQWRTVRVLCDLIMPADERSGSATQAGVPEFIDDWLDFRTQEDGSDLFAAQVLGAVMWVDQESMHLFGKDFASASTDQQK